MTMGNGTDQDPFVHSIPRHLSLLQLKAARNIVLKKTKNRRSVLSQQNQHLAVTRIAHPQPNDLRGDPYKAARLAKSSSFVTITKP